MNLDIQNIWYGKASKENRRNKYKINEKKIKCANGRVSKKLDA